MATVIGAYEAKTHLSEILRRVQAGEFFTISRNGRPVATLSPCAPEDNAGVLEAIDYFLRDDKKKLSDQRLQEMLSEGRR